MANDFIITIPDSETDIASTIESDSELGALKLTGAGIDGGGQNVVFLIPLTTLAIHATVAILRAHWDRQSKIIIEVEGKKFRGVTPEEAAIFLQKHSRNKN